MAQITLNSSGVASSGSLLLQTNGTTTQATVDTSGNLGLGVTPSAFVLSGFRSLEIGGVGSSIFAGANDQNALVNAYYNSGWKYAGTGVATRYQMNSGEHRFYTAASGTAGNAISFTQAMTLDASGRLGIGVTSPSYNLDVSGDTINLATGAGYPKLRLSDTNTGGGGKTYYMQSIVGVLRWVDENAGAERMRIDSSGNLLLNTTTNPATGKLAIAGNNGVTGSAIAITNQSGTSQYYAAAFYNNGNSVSYCGSISISGTTTQYATSSDYRLKENIVPLTGALATVAQLKPCTYSWKATGQTTQGFIAHELQEVLPDAVVGEKDAVDENGNPKYQGIDTSFLVATLTAAIQELNAKFEAYKAAHP
jgi:hypothetical protein